MEKEEKRMLEKIDLTKKMEKEEYEKRMKRLEPERDTCKWRRRKNGCWRK